MSILEIIVRAIWYLFVLGVVLWWFWRVARTYETHAELKPASQKVIQRWAENNHYVVKALEQKVQFAGRRMAGYGGPFHKRTGWGQQVYRVVITQMGEEKCRVAWIQVGKGAWDDFAEDFKVIWEDEWRPPEPPAS